MRIRTWMALPFLITLAACNSSGSPTTGSAASCSFGDASASAQTRAIDGQFGGQGTISSSNFSATVSVLTYSGTLYLLVEADRSDSFEFSIDVDANGNLFGAGVAFITEGEDGTVPATLSGSVNQANDQITGSVAYGNDSFTFTIDRFAPQQSPLANFAGTWFYYGDPQSTFSFNGDGGFTGQLDGCSVSGNLAVLDQDTRLYSVDMSVSGCEPSGRECIIGALTTGPAEDVSAQFDGFGRLGNLLYFENLQRRDGSIQQ